MSKVNTDIKNQFEFYTELIQGSKVVRESTIFLDPKPSNTRWLIGDSIVDHATVEDTIALLVEKSRVDKKYGIKLVCKALTVEPFFRFDSDGPAHRNDDPAIPLVEQSVTTPHFNAFNDKGRSIAYKTQVLKMKKEAEAIVNDVNFGMAHFCQETNMTLIDGGFPIVADRAPELELKDVEDIFKGVNFD